MKLIAIVDRTATEQLFQILHLKNKSKLSFRVIFHWGFFVTSLYFLLYFLFIFSNKGVFTKNIGLVSRLWFHSVLQDQEEVNSAPREYLDDIPEKGFD